jgi:hypothetical protein
MSVEFFNPTNPLPIIDAAWVIQMVRPNVQKDRSAGPNADGDEAAAKEHNTRTSINCVYKCYATAGSLSLPKVGVVSGEYHIDSIRVDMGADWPTLTVTAHKHSGSTHAEASCRTYTSSVTIAAGWGVPLQITGAYVMSDAALGSKSASYQLAVTHVDELDLSTGEWKAGENRDGVETADAEFLGQPSDGNLTVTAGWTTLSSETPDSNTASSTRSISLEHHIAKD